MAEVMHAKEIHSLNQSCFRPKNRISLSEEDNMKRQTRAMHVGKSVVVTISLCGLLNIVPYRADAQEQGAVAAVPHNAAPNTSLSGVTSSTKNPNQIAILHWYNANQTASIAVGNEPNGVAFDGTNIWVANAGGNNVTKLRASDGATLGIFDVGMVPWGVAFDGANIWVANNGSGSVTKLRASDGTSLGTFVVGGGPRGLAFDGANVWVPNTIDNNVTKLRASDGTILGKFAVGSFPQGVAFDLSLIHI